MANGSAYESVHRRIHRLVLRPRTAEALDVPQIMRKINRAKVEEIRRRYAVEDPGEDWPKYLALDQWMEVNLRRVEELSLDRGPCRRVLDLGCGAGYFLGICRQLGHEVLGVDVDEVPMFREMTEALGLRRMVWRIQPFVPLPDLGTKFNLITAFMVCFNGHKTEQLWGVAEWDFFLDDLRRHLALRGRICLELNREFDGTHYTEALKELFETRGAEIRAHRVVFNQGLPERSSIARAGR